MLNRTVAPKIHEIKKLTIPPVEYYMLDNGVQVCEVNMGSLEVLKIEIVHVAGRTMEDKRSTARSTASLLKEGCGSLSSADIHEAIDFYGAGLKAGSNMDFSYTSLHTMTKFAPELINLVGEMYNNPTFPDIELKKFKEINIENLKEEFTKNNVLIYRKITEEIFGKDNPYGYNSMPYDYQAITKEDIYHHYNTYYGSDNMYIFISGKVDPSTRMLINQTFGQTIKTTPKKIITPNATVIRKAQEIVHSPNLHQNSIAIGRGLFDRHHADNVPFFVTNTLLGGYFGSRLMEVIREDKGWTYDISSSIDQMLYDGCFYITSEAAPEFIAPILKETYHQMELLRNEKVKNKELNMVKNYLMGIFMNMLDGPMNVSAFAKSMILTGQKISDFEQFIDEMQSLTPDKIRNCAQTYLNPDDMIEAIVTQNQLKNT